MWSRDMIMALRSAAPKLDDQVRRVIQSLRRGCRPGRQVHQRTARVTANETATPGEIPAVSTRALFCREFLAVENINNLSAVRNDVATTTAAHERGRTGGLLKLHAGRREVRTPVLISVDIVNVIPVVVRDRPATNATRTVSVARLPSALVRVSKLVS